MKNNKCTSVERFNEILEKYLCEHRHENKYEGDNVFQGLVIISKYIDYRSNFLIAAADDEEIISVYSEELVQAGITEEDVKNLALLNWGVDEDGNLVCFV